MRKAPVFLLSILLLAAGVRADEVLIVADEFPVMEYLSEQLKTQENLPCQVVGQDQLPENLAKYSAIIVYIHKDLTEAAEKALIEYTRGGGKLIALHHSISSGKRKNKEWFPFLGIELLTGDVSEGGYKWIEPATLEIVNLAPDHFITTNKVHYPKTIVYIPSDAKGGNQERPGFELTDSEVYLNHTHTKPHTLLLGFKYKDEQSGKVYMQDRAGWLKPADKGLIIYLLPGHSLKDFQNPAYARLVLNAVIYRP